MSASDVESSNTGFSKMKGAYWMVFVNKAGCCAKLGENAANANRHKGSISTIWKNWLGNITAMLFFFIRYSFRCIFTLQVPRVQIKNNPPVICMGIENNSLKFPMRSKPVRMLSSFLMVLSECIRFIFSLCL